MKFCGNCGAQMEDNATFCGKCGSPAAAPAAAPKADANIQEKVAAGLDAAGDKVQEATDFATNYVKDAVSDVKNKKFNPKKLIPLVVVAGVVIFFIVFFFRSIVGTGALTKKAAVKDYLNAMAKGKTSKYISATYNHKLLKNILDEYDMDKSDFKDALEEGFDDTDKVKISKVKIKDAKKWSKSKVEKFEDAFDVNITKMYTVEVSFKVKYDGDTSTEKETLYLYKMKGNWYVCDSFLGVSTVAAMYSSSSSSGLSDLFSNSSSDDYDYSDYSDLLEALY